MTHKEVLEKTKEIEGLTKVVYMAFSYIQRGRNCTALAKKHALNGDYQSENEFSDEGDDIIFLAEGMIKGAVLMSDWKYDYNCILTALYKLPEMEILSILHSEN